MKHVIFFSGGLGSYWTARWVKEQYGTDDLVLYFTDTSMEDEDLYRFLDDTSKDLGVPITVYKDGRTPWDVFFERRFLGNSRIDPCSFFLKREPAEKYIKENYSPENVILYFGIDWTEYHRFEKIEKRWKPYQVKAPLCDIKNPYSDREYRLNNLPMELPRLYKLGFPHNNCGGFCVKAGHAHFKHLLLTLPDMYAYHEQMEQAIRKYLDKDVSILEDRRGGIRKPITLKKFRDRLLEEGKIDENDWGGCGCFIDYDDE